MKVVEFEKVKKIIFFLKNMSALKQNYWDKYKSYSCCGVPKPHNTLLLINDCNAELIDKNGNRFYADKSDLFYMPTGAEYTVNFSNAKPDNIHSIVLHFTAIDENGEEIIFTDCDVKKFRASVDAVKTVFESADEFLKQEYSPAVLLKCFYGILCEMFETDNTANIKNSSTVMFENGVELLRDIRCGLTINEIAMQCALSECYFRRLFYKKYKTSPAKFRNKCRIEQAKKLLMSEGLTVTEISGLVGFSDVYYFSKVFKKITGVSPKKYNRL